MKDSYSTLPLRRIATGTVHSAASIVGRTYLSRGGGRLGTATLGGRRYVGRECRPGRHRWRARRIRDWTSTYRASTLSAATDEIYYMSLLFV